jgi:hypothetical protein
MLHVGGCEHVGLGAGHDLILEHARWAEPRLNFDCGRGLERLDRFQPCTLQAAGRIELHRLRSGGVCHDNKPDERTDEAQHMRFPARQISHTQCAADATRIARQE